MLKFHGEHEKFVIAINESNESYYEEVSYIWGEFSKGSLKLNKIDFKIDFLILVNSSSILVKKSVLKLRHFLSHQIYFRKWQKNNWEYFQDDS